MRGRRATGPLRPVPSAFVEDLIDHWREHGRGALDRVCGWAPRHYLQLVAALAPAPMSEAERLDALSDEELREQFTRAIEDAWATGLMPGWIRVGEASPAPVGDD